MLSYALRSRPALVHSYNMKSAWVAESLPEIMWVGLFFGHGDSGTTAVQSGARKFRVCVRIRRPRTFYLMVALQKHFPANSQLTGSPQNGVIDSVDTLELEICWMSVRGTQRFLLVL